MIKFFIFILGFGFMATSTAGTFSEAVDGGGPLNETPLTDPLPDATTLTNSEVDAEGRPTVLPAPNPYFSPEAFYETWYQGFKESVHNNIDQLNNSVAAYKSTVTSSNFACFRQFFRSPDEETTRRHLALVIGASRMGGNLCPTTNGSPFMDTQMPGGLPLPMPADAAGGMPFGPPQPVGQTQLPMGPTSFGPPLFAGNPDPSQQPLFPTAPGFDELFRNSQAAYTQSLLSTRQAIDARAERYNQLDQANASSAEIANQFTQSASALTRTMTAPSVQSGLTRSDLDRLVTGGSLYQDDPYSSHDSDDGHDHSGHNH